VTYGIRLARIEDVPEILTIYNDEVLHGVATFDTEAKSLDERVRWFELRTPKYPILIAESSGHVLGWASVGPWSERKAYDGTVENSVYIEKSARQQGIGKALLERLLQETHSKGFHTVIARITDGNQISIKLHTGFGFREIGTIKEAGNKFGKFLDVTLMQKLF
jgi:L-amino acid N-acyltransferase YncA